MGEGMYLAIQVTIHPNKISIKTTRKASAKTRLLNLGLRKVGSYQLFN
jgi:hypothetical protein